MGKIKCSLQQLIAFIIILYINKFCYFFIEFFYDKKEKFRGFARLDVYFYCIRKRIFLLYKKTYIFIVEFTARKCFKGFLSN